MILGAKIPVNPGTELGVSQLRPQMLFILQRLCHVKLQMYKIVCTVYA